jgi:hypothetical protein
MPKTLVGRKFRLSNPKKMGKLGWPTLLRITEIRKSDGKYGCESQTHGGYWSIRYSRLRWNYREELDNNSALG